MVENYVVNKERIYQNVINDKQIPRRKRNFAMIYPLAACFALVVAIGITGNYIKSNVLDHSGYNSKREVQRFDVKTTQNTRRISKNPYTMDTIHSETAVVKNTDIDISKITANGDRGLSIDYNKTSSYSQEGVNYTSEDLDGKSILKKTIGKKTVWQMELDFLIDYLTVQNNEVFIQGRNKYFFNYNDNPAVNFAIITSEGNTIFSYSMNNAEFNFVTMYKDGENVYLMGNYPTTEDEESHAANVKNYTMIKLSNSGDFVYQTNFPVFVNEYDSILEVVHADGDDVFILNGNTVVPDAESNIERVKNTTDFLKIDSKGQMAEHFTFSQDETPLLVTDVKYIDGKFYVNANRELLDFNLVDIYALEAREHTKTEEKILAQVNERYKQYLESVLIVCDKNFIPIETISAKQTYFNKVQAITISEDGNILWNLERFATLKPTLAEVSSRRYDVVTNLISLTVSPKDFSVSLRAYS